MSLSSAQIAHSPTRNGRREALAIVRVFDFSIVVFLNLNELHNGYLGCACYTPQSKSCCFFHANLLMPL